MPVRVAIYGFGRIGRQVLRIGIRYPELEFVAVNDLVSEDHLGYLLKYDSSHGRFHGTVETRPGALVVNQKPLRCLAQPDAYKLPWRDIDVAYVVESRGKLTSAESSLAGAHRVIVTAPTRTPPVVPTFVPGVNLEQFHQPSDSMPRTL